MSKMSKAIAVLGVVAGLGVAAMPLSSYAIQGSPATANAVITASVDDSIAIDITAGTNTADGSFTDATDTLNLGTLVMGGAAKIGSLNVNVYSNSATQGYNLTIEPATADSINMVSGSNSIPATAGGAKASDPTFIGTTNGGWAFTSDALENWTALSNTATKLTADNTVTGTAEANTIGGANYTQKGTTEVKFAAAAGTSTPAGDYTVTVKFTATAE